MTLIPPSICVFEHLAHAVCKASGKAPNKEMKII